MNENAARKAIAEARKLLKRHREALAASKIYHSEMLRAYHAGPEAYKAYIKRNFVDNPFAGKKFVAPVRPVTRPKPHFVAQEQAAKKRVRIGFLAKRRARFA